MKNLPPIPFFVSSLALVVVGMLSTLNLACPICNGTGFLKAAQGLEVKDPKIKLLNEVPVFGFGDCGVPRRQTKFTYAVNMTLTNNSSSAAKGTLKVVFSSHPLGSQTFVLDLEGNLQPIDYVPPTVPAYVDVAAGQTKTMQVTLTYIDIPVVTGDPEPVVTISAGEDVKDPTCGGTGKLTFAKWIGAKLKPPSFN